MQQIIKAVCIEKRVPDVPDSAPAAALLRRCFAFAPGQRPTSAEVAKALADDPASKGKLARRQRAAKEQAAELWSELQERAQFASAQGGAGMAALQKTSRAGKQDVQVDHELSLTLRQYDLQQLGHDVSPLEERLGQCIRQVHRLPLLIAKVVPNVYFIRVAVCDDGNACDFANFITWSDTEKKIDHG